MMGMQKEVMYIFICNYKKTKKEINTSNKTSGKRALVFIMFFKDKPTRLKA